MIIDHAIRGEGWRCALASDSRTRCGGSVPLRSGPVLSSIQKAVLSAKLVRWPGPAATPPRLPSNARRSNARARNWSSRVVSSSHPPRTINGLLHREVLNLIGQQRDARPATQKAELVAGRAPARARSGPRLVTASRRRTPLRPQAQSRSIESRLRRVLSDGSPALPEPQQPRTEGFG